MQLRVGLPTSRRGSAGRRNSYSDHGAGRQRKAGQARNRNGPESEEPRSEKGNGGEGGRTTGKDRPGRQTEGRGDGEGRPSREREGEPTTHKGKEAQGQGAEHKGKGTQGQRGGARRGKKRRRSREPKPRQERKRAKRNPRASARQENCRLPFRREEDSTEHSRMDPLKHMTKITHHDPFCRSSC